MSTDLAEIRAELAAVNKKLDAFFAATKAEAVAVKPLTVSQFAAKVDRCTKWVYERIESRQIKVLPGGRPYKIPVSELRRFTEVVK